MRSAHVAGSGRRGRRLALARQERLQARPHVFPAGDLDRLEVVRVDAPEHLEKRMLRAERVVRLDLAVAEQVGHLAKLLRGLPRLLVVRRPVLAIRAMKGVDVPERGEIGRASGRERGGQYVELSVGAVS